MNILRVQPTLPHPLAAAPTLREKTLRTTGDLLMLIGLVLLLYVGGLYTQEVYGQLAARGDTDLPAPEAVVPQAPVLVLAVAANEEPAPFVVPRIMGAADQPVSAAPAVPSVSRLRISAIELDTKVVPVGWEVAEQNGQQIALWQVAKFAVGQHRDSANPGDGTNIVLAGHVGGYGKVFRQLNKLATGDQVIVDSQGREYLYVVASTELVREEGVSAEQQAANAQFIAPTDREIVTLITCWPPSGPDKYAFRLIVRAHPYGATGTTTVSSAATLR